MRRLPPLAALPAFEATARLGSMTAAAAELGRTHSAVSKQVRHLQQALGTALFERDGAGLRLTPDGEAYRKAVALALDALERAGAEIGPAAGAPTVTVKCSTALAARWLIPRLPGFRALRPEVDLRLAMSAGGARFARDGTECDVILSWDRLSHPLDELTAALGPDSVVTALGDAEIGPVAAAGLPLWREGEGWRAPALIDHDEAPELWARWREASGVAFEAPARASFPSTSLCIEAAVAGMGAALAERRLVDRDLESGALVAPCGFTRWPGGFVGVRAGRAGRAADAFLRWAASDPPRADRA
jgi:DNA-binding transcriptional LysR family regulator